MWARLSIVAGLVVGVAAAGVVLGGILAFAPDPPPPSAPAPTTASATSSPTPTVSATPSATSSPTPAASASAAPSATALPSASVGTAPFHIGQPAPALSVPQAGGGTIDLDELRGKAVWLTFMTTDCPSCQKEFPLMTGYAERYASDGLVVIAVDVGEDEPAVVALAEQLGATFPLGLDKDGAASREWDAIALPVHFWIDAEGVVRDGALGGIGPDVMAAALGKILPGVDVEP